MMQYRKFIISNYRAITGPLEINLDKYPLMPIIGVNECGKTTILHALFAFDYFNDDLNDNGRHLRDTQNLYKTSPGNPEVEALVTLDPDDWDTILDTLSEQEENLASVKKYRKIKKELPCQVIVSRNIKTREYSIKGVAQLGDPIFNNRLAVEMIRHLPYILYFDDFRDSIEEKIEIKEDQSGWIAIMERLFKKTDPTFSVYDLHTKEERQRKSILAKVKKELNTTLTKEWHNFRLDEREALQISLEFIPEGGRRFIKLDIIESDGQGNEHYFFLRDRSKGFYWFFNFVMKLEFNPKILGDGTLGAIYLLDEPGSYLHASAQTKLCQKLMNLSTENKVIYCTHSHYLLNPEIIPLNSIRVAEKTQEGAVRLLSIHSFSGNSSTKHSALQPIVDALQVKPFMFDYMNSRTVIVEGVYDYYCLEMLKGTKRLRFIPAQGASSIGALISLMIGWGVDYRVIWDHDDDGKRERAKAEKFFGNYESSRFLLLPASGRAKKCILQNLFKGDDIAMIKKTLSLPKNSSFENTIACLFFNRDRIDVLKNFSPETIRSFETVYELLMKTPLCDVSLGWISNV